MKYEEHEKLHKVKDQSQTIGQFLEWLNEQYTLCESDEDTYYPTHINIEKLLATYFEIDLDKIENEKQQMLKAIREGL